LFEIEENAKVDYYSMIVSFYNSLLEPAGMTIDKVLGVTENIMEPKGIAAVCKLVTNVINILTSGILSAGQI